jgi:hypothetical protein
MHKFIQKPKTTQQATPARSTITGRSHFGQSREVSSILHLQRTIGNQAVLRLLQAKQEKASSTLGAEAYTTGTRIGFRAPPDLHTAAYEAAHVVQQGRGVQLSGGVGQTGDRYEHHADAVAARVVQGRSAVDLLEPYEGEQSATEAVQMAPPEMCMQPPVKLDRPFRMFFKRHFMEFLATFPEYGDEKKLLLEKRERKGSALENRN